MQWTKEKAKNIVQKYHLHVNSSDYGDIRKRGNPSTVLKAVAYIRWGSTIIRKCECCGAKGDNAKIELHHKNGIWKDYRLVNLIWLCKGCHLQYHSNQRRMTMSTSTKKSHFKWTDENKNKLNVEIGKHPSFVKGYEHVSKHSKSIFGTHLSYDAIRAAHVKYRQNKVSAKNNRTLLLSDAVKIYKIFTDHGYTIING